MSQRLHWPLRLGILLCLVVMNGDTQAAGKRTILGTVVDKRGNTLPTSVVQLENSSTLEIQSYIVQADGTFRFKEISPDVDFLIHAQYHGKLSKTLYLSRLDSEKKTSITLVIPVE